jgi:hypothetical protein
MALSLHTHDIDACDSSSQRNQLLYQLDLLIVRTQMPFESDFEPATDPIGGEVVIGPEKSTFRASGLLLSYSLRQIVQTECHRDMQSVLSGQKSAKADPESDVIKAARAVASSSLTMVRILRERSDSAKRLQLDRVAIVNGLGVGCDFSNASLRETYMQGLPEHFVCQHCDLSDADLRDLNLSSGADLRGATLERAHFRAPFKADSVLVDSIWLPKALQYLPDCRDVGVHLDQQPTCGNQ